MDSDDLSGRIAYALRRFEKCVSARFLRDDGMCEERTFAQLAYQVDRAAALFVGLGLAAGDRVALIVEPHPNAVAALWALELAGVTCIPLDPSLPSEQLGELLSSIDAQAIVASAQRLNALPASAAVPPVRLELDLATMYPKAGVLCLAPGSAKSVSTHPADADPDLCCIIFSSGTTGTMKGIEVTRASMIPFLDVNARVLRLNEDKSLMAILPFAHVTGFMTMHAIMLNGAPLDFVEHFASARLGEALQKLAPAYFLLVPRAMELIEQKMRVAIAARGRVSATAIDLLMRVNGFARRHLHANPLKGVLRPIATAAFGANISAVGTGAAPVRPRTAQFFFALGLDWCNFYATTETNSPIVQVVPGASFPGGSVGNIFTNEEVEVRIAHRDERGVGEVQVRSQLMMKGYFKRPDLTRQAFEDGWFRTGDYGRVDIKGNLFIEGRIKESIVLASGKKVSPDDVDRYFAARMAGVELASCGVRDEGSGSDTIHLFVETPAGDQARLAELSERVRILSASAPAQFRVEAIHTIDAIPRTPTAKVRRFDLARRAAGQGCDAGGNAPAQVQARSVGSACSSEEERFVALVAGLVPGATVTFSSNLRDDLGFDSLGFFELACKVEECYGVDVAAALGEVYTVGDLFTCASGTRHVAPAPYDIEDYPLRRTALDRFTLRRWLALSERLYRIEAVGLDNLPQGSNWVMVSNHASIFDPFWIYAALKWRETNMDKVCCLAAEQRMRGHVAFLNPLFRRFFRAVGGIPVDRTGNPARALVRATACVRDGYSLLVFPEGHLEHDEGVLPFKPGAAKIALEGGVPLVPVRIDGSFEVANYQRSMPRLRAEDGSKPVIRVEFFKPIDSVGKTVDALTNEAFGLIRGTRKIAQTEDQKKAAAAPRNLLESYERDALDG